MQRAWVVSAEYRSMIQTLIAERQAHGISQRELARRIGKPPSFVNKIELLERRLDVLEFVTIANAIEIDPAQLMKKIVAGLGN